MTTEAQADIRREVRRFYILSAASQFLIDSSIWSFYLTEYCKLSLTQAVAFHAATTAVSGLLDLPTGSWADRFGRRYVVILGFLARALAALLMLGASSTPILVIAVIANGFGWAQLSGAREAFLHDNLKARGEEMHFRRYMSNTTMIEYSARTVAFILSGIFFNLHPTLPYLLLAVALLIGAYCAASVDELPFDKTTARADREHIIEGARVFLRNPALLRASILMLAGYVLAEQLWLSFQPLFAAANMRPFVVGMGYALGAFASVCGARIAKALLVRHYDGLVFCLALGLCACGGVLFATFDTPALLVVAQVVTCVGFGVIAPTRASILHAHLPSAQRAVCLSIFSSLEALLVGLLGCTLGYLYENFNRALPPVLVVLAFVLLVPVVYKALFSLGHTRASLRRTATTPET
jgi:MFS family permease